MGQTTKKRKPKKIQLTKLEHMELEVMEALNSVEFIFGRITEQDELTVRGMVASGANAEQINRAYAIAAVNSRVPAEDKSRYAFGVIRNFLELA